MKLWESIYVCYYSLFCWTSLVIPNGREKKKMLKKILMPIHYLWFSLSQAILAANAGASYVSPFIGRLDDIGEDGVQLVANMVKIFKQYGLKTEIIAASIRNLDHVNQVMLAGAQIATLPTRNDCSWASGSCFHFSLHLHCVLWKEDRFFYKETVSNMVFDCVEAISGIFC